MGMHQLKNLVESTCSKFIESLTKDKVHRGFPCTSRKKDKENNNNNNQWQHYQEMNQASQKSIL